MDVDIRTNWDVPYPNEQSKNFIILSPIHSSEEIPLTIRGVAREVVATDSLHITDYEVHLARAYNELGEEGYLIWKIIGEVSFAGEECGPQKKGYPFLWYSSLTVFSKELWPLLQSDCEEEGEEKNDQPDDD